jgi:hypothetical protein
MRSERIPSSQTSLCIRVDLIALVHLHANGTHSTLSSCSSSHLLTGSVKITRTRLESTTSIDSDITRIIRRHGHPTHSEWNQHPSYQDIDTTEEPSQYCSLLDVPTASTHRTSSKPPRSRTPVEGRTSSSKAETTGRHKQPHPCSPLSGEHSSRLYSLSVVKRFEPSVSVAKPFNGIRLT